MPIVNGQRAKHLLWGTVPIYLLATVGSAATLGLALSLLGIALSRLGGQLVWMLNLQGSWVWELLALLCLGYALHELRLIKMPSPQIKRQVPRHWLWKFHPFITWLLFGFRLGLGITTRIPVGTFYLVLLMALFSGSPLYATVLMGAFGFGRAVMTIILAAPFSESTDGVLSWLGRNDERMHFLNGMMLTVVGALLVGTFI